MNLKARVQNLEYRPYNSEVWAQDKSKFVISIN